MTFKEILEELSQPLTLKEVEVRVGVNSENSFTLLLYKTARTDMRRLNKVCPKWDNSHDINAHNEVTCTIGIWDEEDKMWIRRTDVGKQSMAEGEKGAHSDSFKRASCRFGIGLELYELDTIRIPWDMEEKEYKGKKKYVPKNFWGNRLELAKYNAVDGKADVVIKYDGREIYPTNRKSKAKKSHSADKKLAKDKVDHLKKCLDEKGLDSTFITEQFEVTRIEDLTEEQGNDAYARVTCYEPDIPL